VPKVQFAAAAMYHWPITGSLGGFARADVQHTSARSGKILGLPDSDTVNDVNARLGIEAGSWAVYLSGENLTNQDGAVDIPQSGNAGVARLRPRTIGLKLSYKYE
jgi:hypothetical protein